jgi:hypothetical protein
MNKTKTMKKLYSDRRNMNIPKSFTLAGLKIDVIREDDLILERKLIGEARYSKQQIAIDTKNAPRETTEQSFLHEVIHWCFYVLNEPELRDNEKLVDTLAHLLYQFENTKEPYEAEVEL